MGDAAQFNRGGADMSAPATKGPIVQGWCPGALRPMLSGDGWLVRIRPPLGVLTPVQAAGVATASLAYGNGMLDLSSRANLQLRGIREGAHAALIDDLRGLGLVDPDVVSEAARNFVITPFRDARSDQIGADLTRALAQVPDLPGKFGFAVDTGPAPVLTATSADIRLERGSDGGLILRADGMKSGMSVTVSTAAGAAIALAAWFVAKGGASDGRGRMAALIARGIVPQGHDVPALAPAARPAPGACADGMLLAFAFGQLQADVLMALARCDHTIILTPWRMILVQGARAAPAHPAIISVADDPLLRVTACTGAPGCAQAQGPTRGLARDLALLTKGHLHVSGCAKGCAHPGTAGVTLVATAQGYNLIRGGTAADAPDMTGLQADQIAAILKDDHASSV